MKRKLAIIILVSTFCTSSFSQSTIDQDSLDTMPIVYFGDVYLDDGLIYEFKKDSLYTGYVLRKRKNGHLVQKDLIKNGIIIYIIIYYNGKKVVPSTKVEFNPQIMNSPTKMVRYNYDETIREIIYYDDNGKKILEENYEDDKLTYSCEFNGRKRHGKEFCITKECDTTFVFYNNSKKQRSKTN